MESYTGKGIKDIIAEFPQVGHILESYGIGCGPCTVGICLLKDVLDIHKMPAEKEVELMQRIEAAIYPERRPKQTFSNSSAQALAGSHVFSAPMQILVNEHTIIKRWLALIPSVVQLIDLKSDDGLQIIADGIDLICTFADKLHHSKEEDILFGYFDDSEKIFQVIYQDHRAARNHVKEMIHALDRHNAAVLAHHITAYGLLLSEHIKKEDEILFPWLDSRLTDLETAELAARFAASDIKSGIDQQKYTSFLDSLEESVEMDDSQLHPGA